MKLFPSHLIFCLIGLYFLSTSGVVDAFTTNLQSSKIISQTAPSFTATTTSLNLLQWNEIPSLFVADGVDVANDAIAATTVKTAEAVMDIGSALPEASGGVGVMDIIKNIAFAITAVLFLGAGLTMVTAAIIVPAAAKELESECKELAPELWDEYMAKLDEGQTIADRPDLMQELGAKLEPLLNAKMERQFAASKAKGMDVSKDEAAWKAIDNVSQSIPTPDNSAAVFGSGGASSSSSEPAAAAAGIVSDQWGDDDDGVVDAEVIQKKTE